MSIEFVKHIDALPSPQQLRWWGKEFPWRYQGHRVSLSMPVGMTFRDVKTDDGGNVVWMRFPVLRPCFGMPTAFLIHGGHQYEKGRNGKRWPSRCTSCRAQEACEAVAKKRLRASPAIRSAYDAWEDAGGKKAMEADRDLGGGRASRLYTSLLRSFDAHGAFGNVNDETLKRHVTAEEARQRVVDAERKRAERRQKRTEQLNSGILDDEMLERVWRESLYREALLDRAQRECKSPRWIGQEHDDTARFTARVWRLLTIAVHSGRRTNPSFIASMLIETGLVTTSNQNALRDRVRVALDRIRKLETVILPARERPIWPRLTREHLLDDFEVLE